MSRDEMSLNELAKAFAKAGANKILLKVLASNDNSKNQIYLGGDFEVLQMLPWRSIDADPDNALILKAPLDFRWLDPEGDREEVAPNAQLILYPQYPEVRLSGFLRGTRSAPSDLVRSRDQPGRILALGVVDSRVYAVAFPSQSRVAGEIASSTLLSAGVFKVLELVDSRSVLLRRLQEIHAKGWLLAKRLRANGEVVPCSGTNCGGCTLEAELGVSSNSSADPDFLGWEIKAHSASRITLMTPEPTGGFYRDSGAEEFVRRFGYANPSMPGRLNFSGTFKNGERSAKTQLTLTLSGFEGGDKFEAGGAVQLVNDRGVVAAEWSFAALMRHWTRKHNLASYVTYSKCSQPLSYLYGPTVGLGERTDFIRLLRAFYAGAVFYDPGLNLKNAFQGIARVKKRSQFRTTFSALSALYATFEIINLD